MKISVKVPMNSANSFCIRLYTNRLRRRVGAAALGKNISECGAILLDSTGPVKESGMMKSALPRGAAPQLTGRVFMDRGTAHW